MTYPDPWPTEIIARERVIALAEGFTLGAAALLVLGLCILSAWLSEVAR